MNGPNAPNATVSRRNLVMNFERRDGALAEDSVEPIDPNALLENLEDWERYLQSDPEVVRKLRKLDQSATSTTAKGPKLRGPRP